MLLRIFFFLVLSSLIASDEVLANSQLLHHIVHPTAAASDKVVRNQNWAGAVLEKDDDGSFNYITGTFTVPPFSGDRSAGVAALIGIDGVACPDGGMLLTGVIMDIGDGDTVETYAFYEWYPDSGSIVDDFPVSVDDTIHMTIIAFNATSGKVVLKNLTRKRSKVVHVSSTAALCRKSVEWNIEAFIEGKTLVPLVNFGPVNFTNSHAFGPSGVFTPQGATIFEITQNNETLTSVSTGASFVTIERM